MKKALALLAGILIGAALTLLIQAICEASHCLCPRGLMCDCEDGKCPCPPCCRCQQCQGK